MKKSLSFRILKIFITKNKVSSVVLLISLLVVFVSFLLFYNIIIHTTVEYIQNSYDVKTFKIYPMTNNNNEIEELFEKLENSKIYSTERIKLTYEFKIKDGDASIMIYSYYNPVNSKNVQTGRKINDKDIVEKSKVAISYKIGMFENNSSININNSSFEIVGKRPLSGIEIPYSTGLELLEINSIAITLPSKTSDNIKRDFGELILEYLPEAEIILPTKLPIRVFNKLSLILLSSLIIMVFSIINFLYIFKYIIECNKRDYIILRLCGCSISYGIKIFMIQLFSIITIIYAFSIILYEILQKTLFTEYLQKNGYSNIEYLIVYLSFVIMSILLFVPYIIKFAKMSIRKELSN